MTDDELTATAAEVFAHFDRREAASERAILLKSWALTIFCWDGLLPLVVVTIPNLISVFLPDVEAAHVIANIAIPIAAFFVRLIMGGRYFQERSQYAWQYLLFLLTIIYLIFIDTIIILFHELGDQLTASDFRILGFMYLIYLAAMGIALFPFADLRKTRQDSLVVSTEF